MKNEYDFSKAERGKFYHPKTKFNLPIYLEPEVADYMDKIAIEKNIDIETLVNNWFKKDIDLIQTVK